MSPLTRDRLATALVALGVVVGVARLVGAPGLVDVDLATVTFVVLAFGVGASMAAVVPGFDSLIHGSRAYLFATSALGIIALLAAVRTILAGTEITLVLLILTTLGLWAAATARHAGLLRTSPTTQARPRV